MKRSRSILIVGGGPTASKIALTSSKKLQNSTITIWEKSSSPGRFAINTPRGAAAIGGAICDLGAQWFTASDSRTFSFLSSLETKGLVTKLSQNSILGARGFDDYPQYISLKGSASIVNDTIEAAISNGVTYIKNKKLISLQIVHDTQHDTTTTTSTSTVDDNQSNTTKSLWQATDEDGNNAFFDAICLTIPAPQVLQIKGTSLLNILDISGVTKALQAVTYSTRLVLAIYFPESSQKLFEDKLSWFGKYINKQDKGGDVIRYLSFESRKRNKDTNSDTSTSRVYCPSFISHSTIEFGTANEFTDDYKKVLEPILVKSTLLSLADALEINESDLPSPIETRVHRWKYSQVTRAFAMESFEYTTALQENEGEENSINKSNSTTITTNALLIQGVPVTSQLESGDSSLLLSPPLYLAGDYFTSSNLAGCLKSADAINFEEK